MRVLRFGALVGMGAGGALWFTRPKPVRRSFLNFAAYSVQDDSWAGHTPADTAVERIAPSLYTATSTIFGIGRGRRMTVCVMEDGLLVFSPICLPEKQMAQLFDGQTVRYIVAPNGWHRLDTALYKERFPQALVLAPERGRAAVAEKVPVSDSLEHYFREVNPGLRVKLIDVPFKPSATIQECIMNVPLKNAKRVLLVGDAFQNANSGSVGAFLRPILRLYGVMGRDTKSLQMSRGFRWMMPKDDRKKFLTSLADLCRNDPSIAHVVMCHGEPVEASPALFESLLQRTT